MKKIIAAFCILAVIGWGSTIMAADQMSHDSTNTMAESGKGKMTGMTNDDHKTMVKAGEGKMTGMTLGDAFEHHAVVEGMRAEFKIMSMASMDMKDPNGATHHIMVEFRDDTTDARIEDAVGKIKVIAPDKAEQSGTLKNYSGSYAAGLTFDKPGNYGVICLIKVGEKKYLYKFWYPYP